MVITKSNLIAISTYLKNYVKACFAREKALSDAVTAATTVVELRAIDLEVGWPSNG